MHEGLLPERRWLVSSEKNDQFSDLMDAFGDDVKGIGTVYHYTSAEGLRGIIENAEIWLTNTKFVNDTTECRALWQLTGLFGAGKLTNPYVRKRLESGEREDDSLYIGSFSKAENSLEQWRAYGGFCVGFDVSKMVRKGFNLHRCVYEKADIHDWIIEKSSLGEWGGDDICDRWKGYAADSLLATASRKYKSRDYRHEKEIRLIVRSDHTWGWYTESPAMFAKQPPVHFRDHPAYQMPIPYVKFFIPSSGPETKFEAGGQRQTPAEVKRHKLREEAEMSRELLPITEVWIGPMARQEEAKLACEILLQEKGYEDVEVKASEIPYRGI